MSEAIRRPNVKNIDAAVRLYYEKFELGSKDIREIFDAKSSVTVTNLKKIAREKMAEKDRMPYDKYCVPTDIAYEAWGLDIADLERRRAKLIKLGAVQEVSEVV
jgi:hypothetical protein